MTWWAFGDTGGALELDWPAFELHWHRIGGMSFAWWLDDQGRFLALAPVGLA